MKTLLALVATGLLVAADVKEDDIKKELEKLEGKWTATEVEKEGVKATAEKLSDTRLTFKDGNLTVRDAEGEFAVTFKLDPSKKPKTIEMKSDQQTIRGIYSLDGDNLKVCVHLAEDSKFPTEFTGKKSYSLLVLRREKK
jgi:uncharacterized protein (TIGR03067 family)